MNYKIEKIPNNNLPIYKIDNFVSPDICSQIIDFVESEKYWFNYSTTGKKTVYLPNFGPNKFNLFTREFLQNPGPPELIFKLNNIMHQILNIPIANGEVMQCQIYEKGMQIEPHYDFFNPLIEKDKESLKKCGQRTWTMILYLNEVEKGGETHFIVPNIKIKPEPGKLVFWNNLDDNHQPNYNSIHTGLQINSGKKYILTKWFREYLIKY